MRSSASRWRAGPGDASPSHGYRIARATLLLVPLLLLTFGVAPAPAAEAHRPPPQLVHRNWTTEQGLPQNSITALVQDHRGYLWMATFGGLARFDGVRFRVFGTAEYPGLPSDRLLSLFEDGEGTLWVGCERSGVARLEGDRFVPFRAPDGRPFGMVNAFAQGPSETLWIGSNDGLARVRGDSFARYTVEDGLPDRQVLAILEEMDGTVWIGTAAGLSRMRGNRIEPVFEEVLGGIRTSSLLRDPTGELWIGTTAGLYRLRNDTLERVPLQGVPETATVTALASARTGGLWIGLGTGGVRRVDDTRTAGPLRTTEMVGGPVDSLLEDREGSLWVGTRGDGLHQLSPGKIVSFGGTRSLLGTAAVPIIPDGGSGLWIGLTCGGLAHLENEEVKIFGAAEGLHGSCVWTLLRDHEGTLWIGTFTEGLFRLRRRPGGDLATARIESVGGPDTVGRELRALFETRDGELFVGTDSGAYLYEPDTGSFQRLEGTDGLTVYFITEGPGGSLWLGTHRGVYVARPDRRQARPVPALGKGMVRSIYHDAAGVVWIGTYGSGLFRFDGERAFRFGTHNGLPENMVSQILEDHRGRLWMTGNRGITRVDRKQLEQVAEGREERVQAVLYGKSDGMSAAETNGGGQPAGHLTASGLLWVPTIDGVARVDTEIDVLNPVPPPVHLEEVLVDGRPVDTSRRLDLPRGARNLEVRYTALSFVAPDRVRFRYRLEGFDDDWIEAGNRRTAYYPVIPAGEHRFQVVASNGDEIWNDVGASFAFVAHPPLLESPWTYVVSTIALAGLVWAGALLRMRALRNRKQELEHQVAARTAEWAKLAELTQKLNSGLVLEEVLDYLYHSMREMIPFDRIGFAVVDEHRSTVRAVWERTVDGATGLEPGFEVPIDEPGLLRLTSREGPWIIDDLEAYLRKRKGSEATRRLVEAGMRSNLTCPLRARGRLFGFLFFTSRQTGTYSLDHARFFQQVAGELSLIIEKSRLYQQLLEAKRALEEANRTLRQRSIEDPLTGVANRRAFEERLNAEWRRSIRTGEPLGLLMIDIDAFKAFNDAHGHGAGDECLIAVARALSHGLRRAGDLLARYGGEEFAAILPKTGTGELEPLAETLRRRVEELQIVHGASGTGSWVTVSLGGATTVPELAGDADGLVAAADIKLYEAKRAGKNCVRVQDLEPRPKARSYPG